MPNNDSKTYIVNDQPTDKDSLDFTPYVETLADIIQTGNTPLTVGVFGGWGSGKTSLMKMVKNQLPNDFTVAWFDAWKYDKEETLWRVLLLQVLAAIRKEIPKDKPADLEEINDLETSLYMPVDREKVGGMKIEWGQLGKGVAQGALQIGLGFLPGGSVINDLIKEFRNGDKSEEALTNLLTAVHRESAKIHIDQIEFLEQFQGRFTNLVDSHITKKDHRLVVFVDDLDRCLPEKAIEILEAIKLFLDVPGCVFILGIDQEVIARGIEMKYKEFANANEANGQAHFTIQGIKYLEKIIQLPFQIPPVIQDDMGKFVEGLSNQWPHEECHRVFAEGLGDNPRNIKRTVNTFLMVSKLAEKRKAKLKESVKPIRLAKVVAIQAAHPDLFNLLLKEEPRYLRELEEYYRAESPQEKKIEKTENSDQVVSEKTATRIEPPPALVPFLSQRGIAAVRRILLLHKPDLQDANFAGLPTDELKLYFTLTRSAEAPQAAPVVEAARLVFEPQLVKIPAGKFLMGSTKEQAAQAIKDGADTEWVEYEQPQHTVELSEYSIGKYPITNREYQAFIRDAKYNPPRGWDGDQFPAEKGGHPVVYVSWEDANAYCKWLSEKTTKNYRLPTEAEWEKAARGEDGRVYPWGNDFDSQKANTRESKIGDTSDVGKFSSQGDSPYSCADMAGNVLEWCNDPFKDDEYKQRQGSVVKDPQGPKEGSARVLRGGSFGDNHRSARCANRAMGNPNYSNSGIGFRVVSSPILSL